MKRNRLLLLTGIVALALVGPINASAATIDIFDTGENELNDPDFRTRDFSSPILDTIEQENVSMNVDGELQLLSQYIAAKPAMPLPPGETRTFNFNMNDPVDDGPDCCSDTLHITLSGLAPSPSNPANMSVALDFRSGGAQVGPLSCGTTPPPGCTTVLSSEIVHFSMFGLEVNAFSAVPSPIVGAGLPGLVAACLGLLALARRRRKNA